MNIKKISIFSIVLIFTVGFILCDAYAANPTKILSNAMEAAIDTITDQEKSPETDDKTSTVLAGYYTAWSSYSGFTPDKIDASKLTHISYAFANIGPDLTVRMGYPDIDPRNFKMLNELKKKNPELKTLISIGGWSWSGKFSDAALTEESRISFSESAVAFMKQYGFDGIDIDWEYPVAGGLASNKNRPEDKGNFTLLLKALRDELDRQGAADQRQYLLTIAGGAGPAFVKNTELAKIHEYLDFAMIMTYDFHGPWDKYTDFVSPLHNSNEPSPQYKASFDTGINSWLQSSFPAEKLVAGVPFYGYHYAGVNGSNGLYKTFSSAKAVSYKKITESLLGQQGFKRYFHSESMVPWLYNGSDFVSYEDPESILQKAQYIRSNKLKGAMIWELSHDKDSELLNSLQEGLK